MKKIIIGIFIFCILLTQGYTSSSDNLKTYTHTRMGFSVQYPSYLSETDRTGPVNNSIVLRNESETVKVYVGGGFVDISDMKQMYQRVLSETNKDEDIEVTYKVQKNNWYVLSGYDHKDSSIFYKKYYLINGVSSGFSLSYPIKDKKKYNKLVSIVSKSFQPSKGEYYEEETKTYSPKSTNQQVNQRSQQVNYESFVGVYQCTMIGTLTLKESGTAKIRFGTESVGMWVDDGDDGQGGREAMVYVDYGAESSPPYTFVRKRNGEYKFNRFFPCEKVR